MGAIAAVLAGISAWLMSRWGAAAAGLVAVVTAVALVYWERIKERFIKPNADLHIDATLSLFERLTKRGKTELPTKIAVPNPSVAKSEPAAKREPGPAVPPKPRKPAHLADLKINVPSFVADDFVSQEVEYRLTCDWYEDEVVATRIHCPMCDRVLAFERDARGIPDLYTCLRCGRCGYRASFRGSGSDLQNICKQAVYWHDRNRPR